MNENRPLFILAGNSPYDNLGCEAIVRGTVKVLREYFEDPCFVCLSHFTSEEQYRKQCLRETDDAIVHLKSHRLNKNKLIRSFWRPGTWGTIYRRLFDLEGYYARSYRDMLPYLNEAKAVLSVGGDNYSLDYGVPTSFVALDNLILKYQRPIVIWGASVGPFSARPDFERYISSHLKKVSGIFARESVTIEYLHKIGLNENIYPVADPAFLMDAVQPNEKIDIDEGSIGLNLSPLMAKFATGGDLEQWTKIASAILSEVASRTNSHIYLIPHVTHSYSNDHAFMQRSLSKMKRGEKNITLVPPIYNAAQTKWIISQMAVFAGARTHSTIASLSSGVPTLSFAYSIKARGINQDLFGHTNYCIEPSALDAGVISSNIANMLDNSENIKRDLTQQHIPRAKRKALNAGIILKELLREN